MKSRLIYILFYFVFWLLFCVLMKPIFMLFHYKESFQYSLSEWIAVLTHGFSMDLSTSGYLSVFVALLILISSFLKSNKCISKIIKFYTYVILALTSILCTSDMFLYKYWGFKIDATPLFYLKTPKDAMASGTTLEFIAAFFIIVAIFFLFFFLFKSLHSRFFDFKQSSPLTALPALLIIAVMVLLIRGGVSVSTMNVGRVYFSHAIFLNHSAINPIWNFIYSLSRNDEFATQYRFMDDSEAASRFAHMIESQSDSTSVLLLTTQRPNVIVVILESFGSGICAPLGGEKNVAPNLNRLFEEGVSFTHFYANSFRTDRGLVSIFSGYPAQPTTSLMKYPNKSQNVPKFPLSMKRAGYDLSFFYGGDENFTNMRSYLITSGFEKIISDKDFEKKDMSEKWGAYDHALFNKVSEDLKQQTLTPFMKVVLTLNSHEPFDVPVHRFEDKYLNSVAYTDSCLGVFISDLKKSKWWDNTLVILLPDHAYKHPNTLKNSDEERHRIPMIWIGGALNNTMKVDRLSSQIDLSKTLLKQLGIDASEYIFSKNIFGKDTPEFAFYAFNDGFGLITPKGISIYDCGASVPLREDDPSLTLDGKAYLQSLFDDLNKR